MKSGRRLAAGAAVLVVLAVILTAVVVLALRRPPESQAVTPILRTAAPDPERVGSTGTELEGYAGDLLENAVEDATTVTHKYEKDGKVSEVKVDKGIAELSKVRAETAAKLTHEKRIEMFRKLTPYHVAEAALKESVKAKYSPITADRIDGLVASAVALEESFWAQGDFDSQVAFDSIYEARALLEVCLDVEPAHEGALRRLCDVISSGWPNWLYEGDDKTVQWEDLQRRMDLFVPMYTLWEKHLSKRPASTPEDMYYAADLATATIFFRRPERLRAYEEQFKLLNPNPSPALAGLFSTGISTETGIAVARWAAQGAKANGPEWSCYSDWFEGQIRYWEGGPRNRAVCGFVSDQSPWPMEQPAEYYRTNMMRGDSFVGPEKRRANLMPWHVLLQRVKEIEAEHGKMIR